MAVTEDIHITKIPAVETTTKQVEKPAVEPKEKELTAEDKEAQASFMRGVLGQDEPKAEKPAKGKKTVKDEAAEESEDEPKAEKKPVKPAKAPAAPAVDYEKIAEASTRGALKALNGDKPVEQEKPAESPYAGLDDKEQRKLKVLEHLEKTLPDRYKGVAQKYADSLNKVAAYQAEWEKKNPGAEFEPDAEEHNEFFNKVEVKWEDDDYADALADLKANDKIKPLEDKLNAREAQAKEEARIQSLAPVVYQEQKRTGKNFFDGIGEGFEKIIGENGTVDKALVDKLKAEDPIIAEIVFGQAARVEALARETANLFNGVTQYDEKNPSPIHRDIVEFAIEAEQVMLQQPAEDQLDGDGRKFLSNQQYAEERKKNTNIAKEYWTYTAEELNNLLAAKVTSDTKKAIKAREEALSKSAAKRGFQKGEAADTETEQEEAKPEVEATDEVLKPVSPDSGGDPKVSNSGRSRGGNPKDGAETFMTGFLK